MLNTLLQYETALENFDRAIQLKAGLRGGLRQPGQRSVDPETVSGGSGEL